MIWILVDVVQGAFGAVAIAAKRHSTAEPDGFFCARKHRESADDWRGEDALIGVESVVA